MKPMQDILLTACLLNAWLRFINKHFRNSTSVEVNLYEPIFFNPQTKLDFSSDNPCFYCISTTNM